MELTRINTHEVDLLRELAIRTYTAAFETKNLPSVLDRYYETAFAKAQLLKELSTPQSLWYFAKKNGQILAYLKLNIDQAQTEFQEAEGLEIERIYVDLPFMGQGIGSQLVKFAISKATELKKNYIWLGVWEENPAAIKFYKTHRFKIICTHDYDMIAEIQTDYIMRLDL